METTKELIYSDGLDDLKLTEKDLKVLEDLMYLKTDFNIELDNGEEYRVIDESDIDRIYFEEQEELLEEVYPEIFKNKPWWMEIDMEKTIQNILDADGYAYFFSTYDFSERYVFTRLGNFYFFRIN